MKKLIYLALVSLILISCSEYQRVLQSTDYKFKYQKAKEYYNAKEYVKANTLFQELMPLFRGTKEAPTLNYYYAYSLYKNEDYEMAIHYFTNFLRNYPDNNLAEECSFVRSICFLELSPNVRLDQSYSQRAIEAFNIFISRYPQSNRIAQANKYIDQMREKLIEKSFLSAKQYFKREKFKAAIIALQNSLKDYPTSKFREEIKYMVLKSRYELAINSIQEKKKDRLISAQEECIVFADEFPKSKYLSETNKMKASIAKLLKN